MTRIWLEAAVGYPAETRRKGARFFDGIAHPCYDFTDEPAPTIRADAWSPIRYVLTDEPARSFSTRGARLRRLARSLLPGVASLGLMSRRVTPARPNAVVRLGKTGPNAYHYGQECSIDDPLPTVAGGEASHFARGCNQFDVYAPEAEPEGFSMPTVAAVDKPPYRIPSMAEIAERRGSSGLVAVSTFSGCGGSCLGLEWAGYRIAWASEFVPAAAEVYRLNHPDVPLDTRDVRVVKVEEILAAAGVRSGEVDLMEGSPPCSSFSMAGARSRKWGEVSRYSDTKQRTDDLFWEYTRLVRGVMPRAFIAENVSGLVKGVARGYFREIMAMLKESGYRVRAQMLDAQWLGVPQMRQRVIFIGVRNDLNRDPVFPAPFRYRYSVRDALPWLAAGSQQVDSNRTQYATGRDPSIRWESVDGQPSPTIGAKLDFPNARASAGTIAEARITGRTGPQFTRVESELDEPFNTVQASDPEQTRYEVTERVVHGPGGFNGRLDGKPVDVDLPMSTVRAGDRERGGQFLVEPLATERLVHGTGGFNGRLNGKPVDPDRPIRTVRASPAYGRQFEVEQVHQGDAVGVQFRPSNGEPVVRSLDEPSPTVTAHNRPKTQSELTIVERAHHGEHIHQLDAVDDNVGASMNGYAIEREWYRLHPGETSDKYLNLARPHPDQPSPTITAQGAGGGPTSAGVPGGVASVTHPFEPRKFSIGELKRICGFPDDFEMSGTYAQQWERLGRSVPPPMMRAIGDALRPLLLETR